MKQMTLRARLVRRWVGVPGMVLVLALGLASASAQFAPVPDRGYRESVDAKRPVSGHAIVGMSVRGGAPGDTLYVYTPMALVDGTMLRIDLETPDGRFHGSGLYSGRAGAQAWTKVALLPAGSRPRAPADVPADQIALQVRIVSADAPMAQQSLLATWIDPATQSDPVVLRLHVNSRRAQQMLVRVRDSQPATPCQRLSSPSTVRYDTICEVPLADIGASGSGLHRLVLLRRDGFATESLPFELRL
ncbi:MAG: hypothetical protein HXY24_05070 [Rubrivivax sp.]|nr:hypothetical protein [Rubrivivax sp.]